jgi:hypothetical protein
MNECIDSTMGRIHVCLMCCLQVTIRGLVGSYNDTLGKALGLTTDPCILLGDVNVSILGGRTNYASPSDDNPTTIADRTFANFVETTQGRIFRPNQTSWKKTFGGIKGKKAKLDFAVVYNLDEEVSEGYTDWISPKGEQDQNEIENGRHCPTPDGRQRNLLSTSRANPYGPSKGRHHQWRGSSITPGHSHDNTPTAPTGARHTEDQGKTPSSPKRRTTRIQSSNRHPPEGPG